MFKRFTLPYLFARRYFQHICKRTTICRKLCMNLNYPGVNFINILRTNFSYEHRFLLLHVCKKSWRNDCSNEKFVRKMLMKLSQDHWRRQFIREYRRQCDERPNMFHCNFFFRKALLFCARLRAYFGFLLSRSEHDYALNLKNFFSLEINYNSLK